jgi:hypothetical protein
VIVRGSYQNRTLKDIRFTDYRNFKFNGAVPNDGIRAWRGRTRGFVYSKDGDYLQCHHDISAKREVTVEKGKMVTVEFQARIGKLEPRVLAKKKVSEVRYAAGENRPASYYRLYEDQVKFLPLRDKGIKGTTIKEKAPWLKVQRTIPKAVFDNRNVAKNNTALKPFQIKVELLEEAGIARLAQVRFGMPWAEGKIFNTKKLSVKNPQNRVVPAQFSVLGRYPDKSIKWLLVQFAAPLKANEKCFYTVNYAKGSNIETPLKLVENKNDFTVETGKIKAVVSKKHFNWLKDIYYDRNNDGKYQLSERVGGFDANGVVVREENGRSLDSSLIRPEIEIEEKGRQVITLLVKGKYGKSPKNALSYKTRLRFYASSPVVAVEHTHLNTSLTNEFTDITDLSIKYLPSSKIISSSTQVDDKVVAVDGDLFIRQNNDLSLTLDSKDSKGKMSGTVQSKSQNGSGFSVSIRDAAFRYPKAFKVTSDSVSIDLLPEQPDKNFNKELPHYLEFPFCEGKYRMKWGMSFSENLLFDFSGKVPMQVLDAENDKYVIAVIDRDYLASTGVIPGVIPESDMRFATWDKKIADGLARHLAKKQRQREYGFLNYGDWFGERGRNWGNNEYDLPYGLFNYFARSGNRDAFRLAALGASHQSDVDLMHAYPDRYYIGTNAEHGIGHTGVNYQRYKRATWSFPCQISFEGKNGHTWTGGMVSCWAFTGNARVFNSALLLGEHMVNFMSPNFTHLGTHERSAGWSLKALMDLYRVTYDKTYLNAGKKMVDCAMKEQNFKKGGAWPHRLPKDHSGGNKDAYGNVPFLIATLLEGLYKYYTFAPSPELKRSVISGGMWQKRAWQKNLLGWPYTLSWDCKPYFNKSACGTLVTPTLAYAANLADDEEAFKIAETMLKLAVFRGVKSDGKGISMDLALNAELLQQLYDWSKKHNVKPTPNYDAANVLEIADWKIAPEFRLRAPEHKKLIVQLKTSQAVLKLKRQRYGSRPKCNPFGVITLTGKSGGKVWSRKFTTAKALAVDIPLKGGKGDVFRLIISDDMTGMWQIAPDKRVKVLAKMEPDSSLAGVSMGRYYFNVPKGTKKFKVKVTGVHPGEFGAVILNSKGKVVEKITGRNQGKCRLPWVKYDKRRSYRQTISVNLKKPVEKDEVWEVLLWAAGDIKIEFNGIPSYVSIVPETLPANSK